jgi:hypothetical protein
MYKEPKVQERLESTTAGRLAISVLVVFTVVSVVAWNLPDSAIKERALGFAGPYVRATGLYQNWGVFSPDPRRHSLELVARIRYADGGEETLAVPRGGRLVGGYWDYRWRKWAEWTTTDARSFLWQPAAAWFARRAAADGRRPVQVTLIRRWQPTLPPGPGPSRGPSREYAYYTYEVPSGAER